MSDYIQLESFPNEIFIEIFDYFSLKELYQSFQGLNQRINKILQSLNNRTLRLWSTNELNDIKINQFFSSTISSLIINDDYNISLNQYPKIQYLTYIYATNNQLEHFFQSKFSHQNLKYLNITSDDLSLVIKYFFYYQFPFLKKCILRNIDSLLKSPWRMTPTTYSIKICSNENLLANILQSCSNLKYLSLFIFQYSNISSSLSIYHPYLKYLSIEMTQPAWTIEMIQILFSTIQIPQLIFFRIVSYQPSTISFDFIQLRNIFQEYIPNLNCFQCNILFSKGVELMNLKSIKNLDLILFNHLQFEYHFDGNIRIYSED